MGRVSEYKTDVWENPETGEVTQKPGMYGSIPCCCCGQVPSHGGNYLPDGPIICSHCALFGDLNSIGMILGDAILDYYKKHHTVNRQEANVNALVRSMLSRLEVAVYRAVAVGFEHLTFKKPYHGLKEGSEG
jgi:hypothetical protein